MIYAKESSRTPQEVEQRLREAVQRHKFGVLHVHDLRETLRSKGIELGSECRILDVCNPQAASQVLQKEMKVSTVLPCRISIFSSGKGSMVAAVKPTDLMQATGVSGLEDVAQEIEREIVAMIDEAV
jgi:uncharacterized protein (DUF302 family)